MLQTFLYPISEDMPLAHGRKFWFQLNASLLRDCRTERSSWVASQVPGSHGSRFLPWGHNKSVIFVNKPRNIDELKDQITSGCVNINAAILQSSALLLSPAQEVRTGWSIWTFIVRHQCASFNIYDAGLLSYPGYARQESNNQHHAPGKNSLHRWINSVLTSDAANTSSSGIGLHHTGGRDFHIACNIPRYLT
jgi:hypothetical protein